jgi:hypothetical protein
VSYVAAALLVPAAGYLYLQLEERLPFATLLVLALMADAMVLALLRAHMLLGGPASAWRIASCASTGDATAQARAASSAPFSFLTTPPSLKYSVDSGFDPIA